MESTRQQKVARLLQRELGEYLRLNGNVFLPGKMITVTVVRISPDLSSAKVYLSIYPTKAEEDPIEQLRSYESKIRNAIGKKIRNQLKSVPEFTYYLDDSLDYIDRINDLLND
jgi:ribosome-binding factor A